jgi:hypothetical protein
VGQRGKKGRERRSWREEWQMSSITNNKRETNKESQRRWINVHTMRKEVAGDR